MIDDKAVQAALEGKWAYWTALNDRMALTDAHERNAMRAALEAAAAHLGWQPPEGYVLAPKEPPVELLMSMAVRQDHALAVPGYYDQAMIATPGVTHARRVEVALDDMRKVYEEVVGTGFYSPENAERYRKMRAALPAPDRSEGS